MFLISGPELVIAQCKAGIIGAMPALNARPSSMLDEWLYQIREELAVWDSDHPSELSAPFAINQIVHPTNSRLEEDMALCEKHRVPIIISSLGAREDVNVAAHRWGCQVFHDVIDDRFARKAVEKGADGLVAVACGAGGHAGRLSPFALIQEIRQWFDGPLALSGAIATGQSILAAQVMGADFAYIGSAFIATEEANASSDYKNAIIQGRASMIVNSNLFTGVQGNYLRSSIIASGLDPDALPERASSQKSFGKVEGKAWRDIWGAGQGIGAITSVDKVSERLNILKRQYNLARMQIMEHA